MCVFTTVEVEEFSLTLSSSSGWSRTWNETKKEDKIQFNLVDMGTPKIWKSDEVAQLCPTLCNPMAYSLLVSFIHVIFQVRILESVAISFSRGSSWPRDQTQVSHISGRLFTESQHETQKSNKIRQALYLLGRETINLWRSDKMWKHSPERYKQSLFTQLLNLEGRVSSNKDVSLPPVTGKIYFPVEISTWEIYFLLSGEQRRTRLPFFHWPFLKKC